MTEFRLPELGEDIEEADVLKVLVSEGDAIEAAQLLIEIETEKATLEVPAEIAGTITKIHVSEGDTIKVGQLIMTIEPATGQPSEAEPEGATETSGAEPVPAEEAADAPARAEEQEPGVDARDEAPLPTKESAPTAEQERRRPEPPAPIVTPAPGERPTFASPSVRKFAREIGVDLSTVAGSGPGGRITEDDVKLASRERQVLTRASAPPEGSGVSARFRPLPDFAQWGPVTREPLSRLRRTVSRNMAQSWTEIPHVHLQYHADITAIEELRQQYKERARGAGGNLTISVMMVKVVAAALRAHPRVNSSYDPEAQELILKDYVHIGVAVDTDRGLVVPKIDNVDEKNIIEISVELNEIAERSRKNELTLEEMRGSTFTVTNLGSLGTGYFDPIINWPEVAVLGLGRAERTAVWDEERSDFTPRLIMPLSFGHDHRVLDGADGARFMSWIVEAIRNPMLMALEG
jgi:pyruvate dehydrogenase E2 component (dihydrolipoamide acetyltransferase)